MISKLQAFLTRLENSPLKPLVQFVKFGMVGVTNTLISYSIQMLCYYVLFRNVTFSGVTGALGALGIAATGEQVRIVITTALAFFISVTNSFVLNNRYVFRSEGSQSVGTLVRKYLRTVACYAVTGLLLSPALKLWMDGFGIPFWATSLLTLIVTIPLNFVLNKFWAFSSRKPSGGDEA